MKCEYYKCNRVATVLIGEFGDTYACQGHYIIFLSNYDSHCLPKDSEGEFLKEPLSKWIAERRLGNEWLKANKNPNEYKD